MYLVEPCGLYAINPALTEIDDCEDVLGQISYHSRYHALRLTFMKKSSDCKEGLCGGLIKIS